MIIEKQWIDNCSDLQLCKMCCFSGLPHTIANATWTKVRNWPKTNPKTSSSMRWKTEPNQKPISVTRLQKTKPTTDADDHVTVRQVRFEW